MKIVIDIPKETYNEVCWQGLDLCPRDEENLIKAIKNCMSLPKRNGRLMILFEDKVKENQIKLDFSCQKWISEVGLSNATVAIIEAESEVNADE